MTIEQDALVAVFSRNIFYKRLHFLALTAMGLAALLIIILLSILYILFSHPPQPVYFAADSIGRLIRVIPVNQPNLPLNDVIRWTIDGVESAFSYDYINYRTQLQNSQKYYTEYGWKQYMKALTDSNNLLALTKRKQVVIAKVVDQPKILAQGLLAGAYAWKFQMPVLVTFYESPYVKPEFYNALTVTVIVQRQPILESFKGLGIIQTLAVAADFSNQPKEITSQPEG